MIARKPKKHAAKADSPTKGRLLGAHRMGHSMIYYADKISPDAIAKFWNKLWDAVRVAQNPTISVNSASGTIFSPGFRADVTAYTTHDGFVLHFTVKDM